MRNKYAKPENFASTIRTPLLKQHWVYRAFSTKDELLYVGCTVDPKGRQKEHSSQSDWYRKAFRFTIAGPYNYETAREIERVAIATERPLYNWTPERRAVTAAHNRILKRWHASFVDDGMEYWEAYHAAERRAQRLVPRPIGRGPWRCKDDTVLKAKRADREDARRSA